MNDDCRRYKEELERLDKMLEGVWDQVDRLAKGMENRAWMAYPNEADITDLAAIHQRATATADRIIDRMEEVHRAFNNQSNNSSAS